ALPVIVFYDVFTFHCRDLFHTIQSRLLRLRSLIQLDLFKEASLLIFMLTDGSKLPSVLETLLTIRLSNSMSSLFGAHLTIEFHYLLSLYFIRLAARIPVIANLEYFKSSELKQILTTVSDSRYKAHSMMSIT
ncbi:unnamed protein product, partial [Didymodactylos carnosus]